MNARAKYFAITMLISLLIWAGIFALIWVIGNALQAVLS